MVQPRLLDALGLDLPSERLLQRAFQLIARPVGAAANQQAQAAAVAAAGGTAAAPAAAVGAGHVNQEIRRDERDNHTGGHVND